jgi:predicted nuclease with TOPRIM domain
MSLDEIREKHAAGNETAAEAFHELCSMVEAIECEREERREKVQAKVSTLRTMNARLREKNQSLKAKYHALLDMYNALAEEVHDASDSSSSSDDDSDGECSIM